MVRRYRDYGAKLFAGLVILSLLMFWYFVMVAKPDNRLRSNVDKTDNHLIAPLVYAITPTFTRVTQKADLTRLSHTLMHVANLHWIVVEDANATTLLVEMILHRSGVPYTLLSACQNDEIKAKYKFKEKAAGVGFIQRNEALRWIRNKYAYEKLPKNGGVLYFMDDDNAYDLRLFEQIRKIKRIGVAPVAFAGGLYIEKPLVTGDKVVGFDNQWARSRRFGIDMAGIAINLGYFLNHTNAEFQLNSPLGQFESEFLMTFNISLSDLEVFGADTTRYGKHEVLVWHTKTIAPVNVLEEAYYNRTGHHSNTGWEC